MKQEDEDYLFQLFLSTKSRTAPIQLRCSSEASNSQPKSVVDVPNSSVSCEISDDDFTKLLLKEFDEQNGNDLEAAKGVDVSFLEPTEDNSLIVKPSIKTPVCPKSSGKVIESPDTKDLSAKGSSNTPVPTNIFQGDQSCFSASTPKRQGITLKRKSFKLQTDETPKGLRLAKNQRQPFIYPDAEKEAQRTPGSHKIKRVAVKSESPSIITKKHGSPKISKSPSNFSTPQNAFETDSEQIFAQIDIDLPVIKSPPISDQIDKMTTDVQFSTVNTCIKEKPGQFSGFKMANGNSVAINPCHLEKAKLLFSEEEVSTRNSPKTFPEEDSLGLKGNSIEENKKTPILQGFKTANGSSINTDPLLLEKAALLFIQEEKPLDSIDHLPKSSKTASGTEPPAFQGFKKANGTLVKTNAKDLAKARMLLAEGEEHSLDIKEDDPEVLDKPKPLQMKEGFQGFRLANGSSVKTNEKDLQRAKILLMDDEPRKKPSSNSSEETDALLASYALPDQQFPPKKSTMFPKSTGKATSPVLKNHKNVCKSSSIGFQTAGGRSVSVKPECLSRAAKLFEETADDHHCVPNVPKEPVNIDTQEMASITEAFALDNSWNELPPSPTIKRTRHFSGPIHKPNKKAKLSPQSEMSLLEYKKKHQSSSIKLSSLTLRSSSIPANSISIPFESIEREFLEQKDVKISVLPPGWIRNHYKWISWKLMAYEGVLRHELSGVYTKNEIVRQLNYRYDVEIRNGCRSALRKIYEQDDTPQKTMVLFIDSIKENVNTIVLSDGWYSIKAQTDTAFSRKLKGKLRVGSKLLIHGAELLGSPAPCHPLEGSDRVCLNVASNMVRRAKWYSKLGYQRLKQPKATPIAAVLVDGGIVAAIEVCVSRKYPLVYLDKRTDSSVMLSEKDHQKNLRVAQTEKAEATQKIYDEVSKELGDMPIQKFEFPQRLNSDFVESLDDGEKIVAFMIKYAEDECLLTNLTQHQIDLARSWKEKQSSKRASRIQEEVNKRLADYPSYNPVAMLNIGVEDRGGTVAMVTVWRPHAHLVEQLQEGKCFTVRYLSANGFRNGVKQLVSHKNTSWRSLSRSFSPRYGRIVWPLDDMEKAQPWREMDVVGLVLEIRQVSKTKEKAMLVSNKDTLVCVTYETMNKQNTLENQLKLHDFACVRNAKVVRKSHRMLEVQIIPHSAIETSFKEQRIIDAISQIKMQCPVGSLISHGESLLKELDNPESPPSPVLCGEQRSRRAQDKIELLQKRYGTPSPLLASPSAPSPLATRPYRRPFRQEL